MEYLGTLPSHLKVIEEVFFFFLNKSVKAFSAWGDSVSRTSNQEVDLENSLSSGVLSLA